jgi:hypothetical protein
MWVRIRIHELISTVDREMGYGNVKAKLLTLSSISASERPKAWPEATLARLLEPAMGTAIPLEVEGTGRKEPRRL